MLFAGAICFVFALVVVTAATLSRPPTSLGTPGAGSTVACSTSNVSVEATGTAPDGVDASGMDVSYNPANLIDSDETTAWRTPGKGVGRTITLSFEDACELTSLQIVDGYNKIDPNDGTDRWHQNRRVVKLGIQANSQNVTVSLDSGSRAWQMVPLSETQVTSISLTIRSSAPSKTERDYTAMSEIRVA